MAKRSVDGQITIGVDYQFTDLWSQAFANMFDESLATIILQAFVSSAHPRGQAPGKDDAGDRAGGKCSLFGHGERKAVMQELGIMTELEALAAQVGACLLARGEWLAVAESCTGGWVAETVTAIAGSSAWFDRGFVTYSNAAKQEMLGVPALTLATHGAVSEATALAMAEGVIRQARTDWSLAISGVAGPGGGTVEKPVGFVCFAWASREGGSWVESLCFPGDRRAVREQSVRHALQGLLARLQETGLVA